MNEVRRIQNALLNVTCASLIKEPDYSGGDERTKNLVLLATEISLHKPEFLLKLALYLRDDLNIRSTANFLVALSSTFKQCRPYLKLYVPAIVRLPSDWIEIAKLTKKIPGRTTSGLPNALRNALIIKFSDFDEFSLSKYNKEKSITKKNKRDRERGGTSSGSESDNDERIPQTLKQMIRNLHIDNPVYHVMCITGKRYPATPDEFKSSKLPGEFEPDRAGKRMKLKMAETWETLLSAKGNKASTWHELLDGNKLPFMAMLRNLRNMLEAGISPAHHEIILKKLTDERTIANSRQFPFRFFSAYEAIDIDLEELANPGSTQGRGRGRGDRGRGRGAPGRGEGRGQPKKKIKTPEHMPTPDLLQRYRDALDTSVKLATMYNIRPIHGTTIVLCNVGPSLNRSVSSAKGMGSVRTLREVAVLLALMFKYSCEECSFWIYNGDQGGFSEVNELGRDTILKNVETVVQMADTLSQETNNSRFPLSFLNEVLVNRKKIDSLVVLSDTLVGPSGVNYEECNPLGTGGVSSFLEKYRQLINPDLLYVTVNMAGGTGVANSDEEHHPNDVALTGFSDSILRFVAERGEGQLEYVERIREIKKLKGQIQYDTEMDIDTPSPSYGLSLYSPSSESDWKTFRFFISSTFTDMFGERKALATFVFPTLRQRCMKYGMRCHLIDVDFRWGITSEEAQSGMTLGLCLNEVERCQFFIGLLGERYGWMCNNYNVDSDEDHFTWLNDYPTGRSVTELEIMQGALRPERDSDKAFIYMREPEFMKTIPTYDQKQLAAFVSESPESAQRMGDLKRRVRCNNNIHQSTYSCQYAGVVDGTPQTAGLSSFVNTVIEDIWNVLVSICPADDTPPSELDTLERCHREFRASHNQVFAGRLSTIRKLFQFVDGTYTSDVKEKEKDKRRSDVLVVVGEAGVGKSAVLSKLSSMAEKANNLVTVSHFLGCGPGSCSPVNILYHIALALITKLDINNIQLSPNYEDLCIMLPSILKTASIQGRVLLIIDNLDALDEDDLSVLLNLVPDVLPSSVKVLLSSGPNCPALSALRQRSRVPEEMKLLDVDAQDRETIVNFSLELFNKKLEASNGKRKRSDAKAEGEVEPKKAKSTGHGHTPAKSNQPNQLSALVSKPGAGKPLYLRCAIEYLRIIGKFEKLTDQIRGLPSSTVNLIETILGHIESVLSVNVVSSVLPLFVISQELNGIPESDIRPLCESKIPGHEVAKLLQCMGGLLRWDYSEGTVDFIHTLILEAARKRYIKSKLQEGDLHAKAYEHNKKLCESNKWRSGTPGRFRALMYHGRMSKAAGLIQDLCDLHFIRRTCEQGCAFDLLDSFVHCSKINPQSERKLKEYYDLVAVNIQKIVQKPSLIFQLAANLPDTSEPYNKFKHLEMNQSWVKWDNKDQDKNMCIRRLKASSNKVLCCAFSSNGKLFACGSSDWSARVFEVETARERLTINEHTGPVKDICFSVKGDKLSTASDDTTACVWSCADGSLLQKYNGHTKGVNACAFAIKSDHLITTSDDCSIRLWEPNSNYMTRMLKGHTRPISSVKVHPGGSLFVTGSWDCTIRVWEGISKDCKLICVINAKMNSIRDVAIAPTLVQTVAASSVDGRVKLFDVASKQTITVLNGYKELGRKPNASSSVQFSPDGNMILTCDIDGTMKMFRACTTGEQVLEVAAHYGAVNDVAFSPDGKTLSSVSSDSDLRMWNPEYSESSALHGAMCTGVSFSKDMSFVASSSWDGKIKILDLTVSPPKTKLTMWNKSPVLCVCVVADGRSVISGGNDRIVKVWRVEAGIGGSGDEHGGSIRWEGKGHTSVVSGVASDPNNTDIFASVSWDRSVRIWKMHQGCIHTITEEDCELTCVAYTPDGFLVTGSIDSVMVRSPNDFNLIFSSNGSGRWVYSLLPTSSSTGFYSTLEGEIYSYNTSQEDVPVVHTSTSPILSSKLVTQNIIVVAYADCRVALLEITEQESKELCVFHTKAPCKAIDVSCAKNGEIRIVCVDTLGKVTLLSPYLMADAEDAFTDLVFTEETVASVVKDAPTTAKTTKTRDNQVTRPKPSRVARVVQAPSEDSVSEAGSTVQSDSEAKPTADDNLPLLYYRGHRRLTRPQQMQSLFNGLRVMGVF